MSSLKSFLAMLISGLMLNGTWTAIKPLLLAWLKDFFIKVILLKWLGSWISGKYKLWIAKLIVEYAYVGLAEPIIKLSFRKAGYIYNKIEGKIIIEKIKEAREENDKAKYDSAVELIFK